MNLDTFICTKYVYKNGIDIVRVRKFLPKNKLQVTIFYENGDIADRSVSKKICMELYNGIDRSPERIK